MSGAILMFIPLVGGFAHWLLNRVVFNDSGEDLADKLIGLGGGDDARRKAFGEAARRKAERDFSPELQAQSVEAFYERLLVTVQGRAAGR